VPFRIEWDQAARDDLDMLDAFDSPIIHREVRLLEHHADQRARNRRPLAVPVGWCPEATWQLRIAGYRVLYSLDSGVVRILRIKWKDRLTTEEMGQ
jgi:mRNA-degrading endonuclease RelE of RelBE toxin-antitoxin system